jgi:PPOX class probable F420-dependent enzyme
VDNKLTQLNERQQQLITEPNLAHVVTLMKDGAPQSTPVWVDYADGYVLINTADTRQKARNLQRDPRIALSVVDRNRLGNYVEVRGRVVEMTREGADEHYAFLARKYFGPDAKPRLTPGEQRIIVKIEPSYVGGMFLG